MRRAPDDARGSDGARGGVDLIHASLSSAEKLDIARARAARPRSVAEREAGRLFALYFRAMRWARRRPGSRRQKMKVTK